MNAATLSRTASMPTVTLPADCSQAAWMDAMDWANAHVALGAESTFVDLGDQHVYLFPAAA